MDLSKLLNTVRHYLWLFVLAPLVAILTTVLVASNEPTSYKATTRLLVGPSLESPSPDVNSLKIGGQLVQTYAELAGTRPFLESVNNKLEQKMDISSLNGAITTKQNIESRILTIIVYYTDPKQTAAIARAAIETYVEMSPSKDNTTDLLRTQMKDQAQQLEQMITNSESTIQQLEAQLAELKSVRVQRASNLERQNVITRQLADERGHWSDALRSLTSIYQILLATNTNQLEIIEPVGTPSPVNQDLPLKTAASGVAGLILALVIAFALEYFDDTIRSPQDLSRVAHVPLLSKVERHNRLNGSGLERVVAFVQPQSRAANSYRTAVSKLLLSIGESVPCTFLLNSVGSSHFGDDTATASVNLAVAFAKAGSRVVLVDAQLDNPVLTNLFQAGNRAGLSELLITNSTEPQLIPIEEIAGLRFLPAGVSSEEALAAALNPAKILKLIEELQRDADIVLIAGSPISWSAESLTLASQVKSVILVARRGEAHVKMVNGVIASLMGMNVHLAGIIFDENPSPFISRQKRKIVSKVGRVTSETARAGNLQTTGQVDVDATRSPELTVAAVPADDNTEPTHLDLLELDTIQTPDMGNLPVPTDETQVTSLAMVDGDPAQSPSLMDSITSVDDQTSLEQVTVGLPQTRDLLEEAAAMLADEDAELSDQGQADVDITELEEVAVASGQTEDLEPAATLANEDAELSDLGQVGVDTTELEEVAADSTQTEDPEPAAVLANEDAELADLSQVGVDITELEEVAVASSQTEDLEPAAALANEDAELSDLGQVGVDTTELEEVAAASTQTEDLEPAVISTDEIAELPNPDPVDADTIQSSELAGAVMSLDENLESLRLDPVEVDLAQASDVRNPEMLSQENLELATSDTNGQKAKTNHTKNSNGSRRTNHKKSNKSPDVRNTETLSQENLELALSGTNGHKAKANQAKNSNGSHRTNQRKSNKRS